MTKGKYPDKRGGEESNPWINGDAQLLFNHYYSRLAGIACTRYRWVGLPDNIDPMRVEVALVLQGGLAAFIHQRPDEALELETDLRPAWDHRGFQGVGMAEASRGRFTVTRASYGGSTLDDLFNPSSYRAYGPRGIGRVFTTNGLIEDWEGVPIWGDALRLNYDQEAIELWSNRLARASLAVDANLMATTRGVIVATSQDKLLSAQTVLQTALSGVPAFVTDKNFDLESIKALDLGVHPDTVERSHVVAMRLWNEAIMALGIEAGAQEKEERLTDDEVQAIKGGVEAVRRRTLEPREQAARLINRRYFGGADIVKLVDQW